MFKGKLLKKTNVILWSRI